MKDNYGREITYLRISVTDKCNLRCSYCMPREGITRMPHEELLTLEELGRVVGILTDLGIKKVRITGGEPLVRKNVISLIRDISAAGIEEIAMTTNGVLLAEMAQELWQAGLRSVNISLDAANPRTFAGITAREEYQKVMDAMAEADRLGYRMKINCVPCRGLNEEELPDIAQLARDRNIDVRFIELMPIGCATQFKGIPSDELLARLEQIYGPARALPREDLGSPAAYYRFSGFQARIGFISPMTHQFCQACNRIRLTADGYLKLCLHYRDGLALKPLLRSGSSDQEIKARIMEAVKEKPQAHNFQKEVISNNNREEERKMVQIGG